MSVKKFDIMSIKFEEICTNYFSHFSSDGLERTRLKCFRKDSVFKSFKDMLIFILVYIKTNPLQEYHAAIFKMSQPQANKWIHFLLEMLHKTLDKEKLIPARSGKDFMYIIDHVNTIYIDGTERRVQRSTDYETQKEYFSGKKKLIL
jgi:hypothetical protein